MIRQIFIGDMYGERIKLERINKISAKKLFAAGETIYLQSSNMIPFGVWQQACPIVLHPDSLKSKQELFDKWSEYAGSKIRPDEGSEFNLIVAEFGWYNCDSERGRNIHYYKQFKVEQEVPIQINEINERVASDPDVLFYLSKNKSI